MTWPNGAEWYALEDGRRLPAEDGVVRLEVVDCGLLKVPSGRLVACDPFACMQEGGRNPYVSIPPGTYPVKVTLADVSGLEDGSHIREAYATLLISTELEQTRRCLVPLRDGESAPKITEGEFLGFPVDAGTACFVDDGALRDGMPPGEEWLEKLFEHPGSESWFNQLDDPGQIREGLANIPLPLAKDGSNIVIIHSGWGDGYYPVIGGYDLNGRLVRVHIDFQVVGLSG